MTLRVSSPKSRSVHSLVFISSQPSRLNRVIPLRSCLRPLPSMVSVLENRLDGELKEIADLEVKLLIRRTRARALEKAVAMQKRREVQKLVLKMRKPKRMCIACCYRAVGRHGGPAHTYERGFCRYRSRGIEWRSQ